MNNLCRLAFGAFSLTLFCAVGCCGRNDVYCYRTTGVHIQAASGNLFPEGAVYSLHWKAGSQSGSFESSDEFNDDYTFSYSPEKLVFVIMTSLEGNDEITLEFSIDEEIVTGPETLPMNWEYVGGCNNRSGPAWCEDEPIPHASVDVVLDESEW